MTTQNKQLTREAEAIIPTEYGDVNMIAYSNGKGAYIPHIALVSTKLNASKPVLMRVHSECITGDLFHSLKCDCGEQLATAMQKICEEGGVLIYLRQEGRGIGIINKLKAYKKQEEGMDTIEANKALGFETDYRKYDCAVGILRDHGITRIRLLTNNPDKIEAFENSHIEVVERVPLKIEPNPKNYKYLKTKRDALGHMLDVD